MNYPLVTLKIIMGYYVTSSIFRKENTKQECFVCSRNLSFVLAGLAIDNSLHSGQYRWVCSEKCMTMYIFQVI